MSDSRVTGPAGSTVLLLMAGLLALLNSMLHEGPGGDPWFVIAAGLIGVALFRALRRAGERRR